MEKEAIVVLTSMLVLAGCLQAPTDEDIQAAQAAILEEYEASALLPEEVATSGWYLLPVVASPEGGLAAFEWTVPKGALVPWGFNEEFDQDFDTIAVEVALVDADGIDAWGLVVFDDDGGKLDGIGGTVQMAQSLLLYDANGEQEETGEMQPTTFAHFGLDDAEEGEVLRLLAIARGATTQEVGIAFRILDHDPWYPDSDEEPADSSADFLAARGATSPFGMMPRATGSGFGANAYIDILASGFLPTDSGWGMEIRLGAPSVEWSATPSERAAGGSHTLRASAVGSLPHGFDGVGADYVALGGYERSTYAVEALLHDEPASAEGSVGSLGPIPLFLLGGYEFGYAGGFGDGDGASGATLELDRTRYGGFVSAASVSALELGATLEDLFGVPSDGDLGAHAEGRDLPLPGWIASKGGLTQVRHDGSVWTYPLPRDAPVPLGVLGR